MEFRVTEVNTGTIMVLRPTTTEPATALALGMSVSCVVALQSKLPYPLLFLVIVRMMVIW